MTGLGARILVVEDHAALGRALTFALDAEDDLAVVGLAATMAEALEMVAETQPDVVLMDVNLPDGNGIDATPLVLEIHPKTAVIVLTAHADEFTAKRAAEAGAAGFVLKAVRIEQILTAVRSVIAGQARFEPPAG